MNTNPADKGSGGGAERRRYVRQPIRLDALVAIDGRPAVPCTVRDFCIAGIFVAISPQQLRLVQAQTKAILYFALVVDGVQSDYHLNLNIFRVVGGGLGCGFENGDPQTIALLQSLAAASNPPAAPATEESVAKTQGDFSARFPVVKAPLLDIVAAFAEAASEDFLRTADEALFIAARDASNNREETRYLDGQNELRARRTSLIENVPKLLGDGVAILNNPLSNVEAEEQGPALSELSLVDKDEFEEFLTVAQLVSELEPRFKDPIFQLDSRFSALAKREIDERSNPIGPTIVGSVFAEELKNLQSDRSAINVIYQALRKTLESTLGQLYEDVNRLLVENGILPVIEKTKANYKRNESTASQSLRVDEVVESIDTGQATAPPLEPLLQTAPPTSPTAPVNPNPTGHPGHVQAAAPPRYIAPAEQHLSPGFDVIDPTAVPNTQVQAAMPSLPAGAAYPSPGQVQPGSVQAAPHYPAGPAVAGAPPSPSIVNPGQVSAGMPATAGGAVAAPMGFGLEATFGGFGTGPAVYVPPSLQQAYSAAQAQMALRRELNPVAASEAVTLAGSAPAYQQNQIISGLTQLQKSLATTQAPQMLDVQTIKQRITEAISKVSGESGRIGQSEGDAIEVIANLFEVLIEDALLTDNAKQQLTRLQAPVHKAALMDPAFFEATDHPVRQLLNRVSMLRDSHSSTGSARDHRVEELIARINNEFDQDINVFEPVLGEFDQILREQRDAYNDKVAAVVQASEEQEKVLNERRGKNLEATDASLAQNELSEEWNRWLDRGKMLEAGERMIMNATSKNPSMVTLVWVGPGFNPYVFVDERGEKTSTLTLQQVAMFLRRGTLKALQEDDAGAVDRALFGVVNRMHSEVEVRATHDELTDFMNKKTFLQTVERLLPDGNVSAATGPALCQISLDDIKDINDTYGTDVGDAMLNAVAEQLRVSNPGKAVSFGRIGGTELAVFWHKGGMQNAYKKIQSCFETFAELDIEAEGQTLHPTAFAGITSIDDGLTSAEQLLSVVADACKAARSARDKPIYVAGSENKFREQLEQMVSYIGKAFDRGRLALLHQNVNSLLDETDQPAMHIVVTAEDRNGKLVPPTFFKQALANSERAFEIDEWTLKSTFRWMADHADDVDAYAAVIIPLSHEAVKRDDLSNVIINLLMETAVPPGKIFFEIADKDAIANVTETAELVRTLKEFGCRFILDEFGSGQQNYDYVKELAVDFVTIQTGYISEAKENPKDFAMAKSINELIHFMGKKTIGKQDPGNDVVEVLREIGVDFIYDQSKTSRIAA